MQPFIQPVPENFIYQDSQISISNTRIVLSDRVFLINNLSSVRPAEIPPQRIYPSILLAIGIILFLAGFRQLADGITLASFWFVVITAPCLIGGCVWLSLQKTKYSLKLGTSSGEVDGLISEEKDYVLYLANQVSSILSLRGIY